MPARVFWFEDWWPVMLVCLAALAALFFSFSSLRRRRSRDSGSFGARLTRVLRKGVLALSLLLNLSILGLGVLLLIQFGAYHALNEWEVVARVECGAREKHGEFSLEYTSLAGGRVRNTRSFQVYGDRWSILADVVEWRGFMRYLGLRRSFRIVRVKGLYDRERDYLEQPVTSEPIGGGSDRVWLRLHAGERRWPYHYFVKSVYRTSVSGAPTPDYLLDVIGAVDGLALRKAAF